MTNEERAEAWSKMNSKQRMAWLRSTATLNISSSQRVTAVAALKRKAGQV